MKDKDEIPFSKVGRQYRCKRRDFDQYLESTQVTQRQD